MLGSSGALKFEQIRSYRGSGLDEQNCLGDLALFTRGPRVVLDAPWTMLLLQRLREVARLPRVEEGFPQSTEHSEKADECVGQQPSSPPPSSSPASSEGGNESGSDSSESQEILLFYLEGRITRPPGLQAHMNQIEEETRDEAPPDEDLIDTANICFILPTAPSQHDEFWANVNGAAHPSDQIDLQRFPLPAVQVSFPHDPQMFLNERVQISFHFRALDRRYNIFSILPQYIILFDEDDEDFKQLLLYLVTPELYLLMDSVEVEKWKLQLINSFKQ
ncbi:hypothetical protein C8J56DRAFT_892425 [Mycena floridula]|nr:hypothetical protein C8J56DRAFT_892425 [Mycena floridula]